MSDLISREKAIEDLQNGDPSELYDIEDIKYWINSLPSAEPKTPSNGSITSVKPENMHDRTMGDLIRRQGAKDAIDMALDHIDHVPPWVYDKLLNVLNEVSSAEPEIIRCRDCKHHDGIRCFRWNSTIITGFDDYCSNAERRGEQE